MLGLCRLFADDTSVGERSLEINHLRSLFNTDLNNITHWAKQWLVKLNLEKTEIMYMYFSTRPSPVDLYFSTDNIKIKPVDAQYFLKCKNPHGVSTSSVRAQPSKQNNRHVLSMYISLYHVT
jgi:hypothetical protein